MGGIDPSQLFSMFMGGQQGFGSNTRGKSSHKASGTQGKKFQGFDGFDMHNFGGFNSFGGNFGQKHKQQH